MANEIRVFIQAIAAGKDLRRASVEYCFAKYLFPIKLEDYQKAARDEALEKVPVCIDHMMCFAMAWNCAKEGGSAAEIEAAFRAGDKIDADRDYAWRPMTKVERASWRFSA